jgi:hypothetical protein
MIRYVVSFFATVAFTLSCHTFVLAGEFTATKTDRGVTVNLDGKLFTEYLIKSGKKPVLWPIIGPTGKPMTRGWPMDGTNPAAKDERDHPWHRSLWFTHGDVNGADLWMDNEGGGSEEHREFVEVSSGKTAKIITKNDWLDKKGKKLAEDERTLTFSTDGDSRIIDFDIVVKASEGKLKFGDTKEGSFGIRVPNDFRLTANKGGRIVNSEGVEGKATWGKPAAWVDYEGAIDGETCGIAVLNHPSSYGYPTHWHVRDYGLFAANPFGLHDFNGRKGDKGDVTLKPGETLKLRYRVIFHKGNEKDARIAESFQEYADAGKPALSPARGRVLIDGKPLTYGYVRFVPENFRASTGKLDQNGNFVLSCFAEGDGAAVGSHRVEILAAEAVSPTKTRWHAPKKYAASATSGITIKVVEGKNEFELNLTWNGGQPFVEANSDP